VHAQGRESVLNARYEIRLSGFGGQGLILAGIILAEAIGLYEGRYVTQTQSYGPEARGGKSRSEVVVSDEPIDYPKAITVDLLLAMSQDACDTYFRDLKSDGILIVDSTLVKEPPLSQIVEIPFTEIARKKINKVMVANIVALGAISQFTDVVGTTSLRKAVSTRAPRGTEKMNLKALDAGIKAAKSFIKE
jgi:2-oxoglutarate ferredoxin oxidoreductase subunit gamma